MVNEIPISGIEHYGGYFPGPQMGMVTASIAEGNTEARLWSCAASSGDAALLLWDKGNNVFYLTGRLDAEDVRCSMARVLDGEVRAQALAEGAPYFGVHALTPTPQGFAPSLFPGIPLREVGKRFYHPRSDGPLPVPAPAVAGVRFVPIDRALLADEALTNADEVRSEVRWMWSSEERFLERGFGVAALVERHILCWCTAEYVSRKACGIGITTDAGCRSRGIATATAARFVAECRTRGLAPYWECAGDNLPSVRVAEKLGFEILEETTVLRGAFAARAAE